MGHIMDRKTLGDIFQEIIVEFSEIVPTGLDVFTVRVAIDGSVPLSR